MSLPDRDPAVDVTLTPDAERITARVDGWMREVRDRAERGQLKYPPWHTATTPRNAGGELREELLDALWYASAAEDQIATLRAELRQARRRIKVMDLGIFACKWGGDGGWTPRICNDDPDDDLVESWEAAEHFDVLWHGGKPFATQTAAYAAAWEALHAAGLVEDGE